MTNQVMKQRQFRMDDPTHDRLVAIAKELRMSKASALRFIINQVDDSFLPSITSKCTIARLQQSEQGATS